MDTEHMMACLIDGKLYDILNAGTARESLAFVTRDNDSPSGFRTVFKPHEYVHGDPVDKQVTPKDAILPGRGIDPTKKDLVVSYLESSFGLTTRQATRVADEARSGTN
jgi:hypothetical protein